MISEWYHPDALKWSVRYPAYQTKPWEVAWMLWKLSSTVGDVLEIGAHYGETTREFALAFPSKTIYAVDCPDNAALADRQHHELPVASRVCEAARELPNVRFLAQNSRSLDYSQFGNVGFIFIDGDHSYAGVSADSENAFTHFASRHGVIAWHDCFPHDYIAVHAYLSSLSQRWPDRFKTIIGTSLAIAEF